MISTTMNEPTGLVATGETIRSTTGAQLFVQTWRPQGEVRGVVAIVPGFKAHSGRYEGDLPAECT